MQFASHKCKNMSYLITVLLSALFSLSAFLSIPFSDLEEAFKKGDATTIIDQSGEKILLNVSQKEGVYSSSQATQILKTFFEKNPASSFSFTFKGKEDGTNSFAVGTYVSKQSYRVSIKFKLKKEKYQIEAISIVEEAQKE